jgi:flagellar biosynthesis protein FlhF
MSDQVRTFRASDPRSALDAVRTALGADAVIVETREVGGLWGRTEIEVTAIGPEKKKPEGKDPAIAGELAALRRVVEELRAQLEAKKAEKAAEKAAGKAAEKKGETATDWTRIPAEAVRICRTLVRRGVDARLAEDLIKEALRDNPGARLPALFRTVRGIAARRLAAARPPWEREERRVIAVVGPTGVGKTTTIAKIAARAKLESRLRVALITIDTYRVGASEHLERYGEIMGIKTRVARDAAALAAAIAATPDAELILVDTAGRSDTPTIASQMALLHSVPDLELHLLLSAAAGAREIAAAGRRYREHGIKRLMLSKLDEADGPGSVLSAVAVVPRLISCVANGQCVPDDIHPADGPVLLDLVTGPEKEKESQTWIKQTA